MSNLKKACEMSLNEEMEKADCSKCATKCRYKHWFEHEMWVKEKGCINFKSRGEQE